MSLLPPAVHRAIVAVDVEGFADLRRTNPDQFAIRDGLYLSLRRAFDRSGIGWQSCHSEDRGDGVLILVPPEKPKSILVSNMIHELAAALSEHNRAHGERARIRLRAAVHAGEVQYDDHGVTATALNLTFRLLESGALKRALARSAGVLAVITSQWFHDEVVIHAAASHPASYRRVQVSIKETQTTAWICRPDDPYPPARAPWRPAQQTALSPTSPWQLAAPTGATVKPTKHRTPAYTAYRSSFDYAEAGPAVPRMLLGIRLRLLRKAHGITRRDAAAAIGASKQKIYDVENGRTGSERHEIAALLGIYGITDGPGRAATLALAAQTNVPGWMHAYNDILLGDSPTCLELEQAATLIRGYGPHFIPRMLQTADYSRAITQRCHPDISRFDAERRVSLIMACQQILHQMDPPWLWMILDERALRPAASIERKTMQDQLRHLIEVADMQTVTIQVIPGDTNAPAGGAITYLRFKDQELSDAVFLEQVGNVVPLNRQADVDYYHEVIDRLVARAASPDRSARILRRIERTLANDGA